MVKRGIFILGLAILGLHHPVQATEPTREDMQAQIDKLQAKVDRLEALQENLATREQVDATVKQVMQDAEQRSQLFAPGDFTAGYSDRKFLLQSGDGRFRLHPYLMIQVRNTTTWRVDGKQPNDTDDTQNGFEIRRAKFGFEGNAFSKELTYRMQFSADRHNGDPVLEDAWVRYQFADGLSLRGGQFRDPFAHDSLVSFRFMAAERTYTNEFFSPSENYVQGVDLIYERGKVHADVAFTDGSSNGSNQNFQDFPTNHANYGGAGRVEYLATGDWTNYEDYTAYGTKNPLLVFGAGLDYREMGDTGVFSQTADVQYENPNGIALYGALYGAYTKNSPAGTGDSVHHDRYNWGAIAQAGYHFLPKWEVFGRWGYLHLDDNGLAAGTHESTNELTTGVNYYLHGQAAKFTLDVGWLPNGAPTDDDGAGILANHGPEYYLRGQFQLLL